MMRVPQELVGRRFGPGLSWSSSRGAGGGERRRGGEEGVPVSAPVPGKLRLLQTGDQPEDPPLFRPGQLRLKSHDVEKDALFVLPPELDDGMGSTARPRVH